MAITRQEIDEMYMDLFGRKAKDAGAEYWMDQVRSGFTTAQDLPRHLRYSANASESGRAELAYGTRLREQAAAQAAAEAAAAEEREAQRLAEVERQEQMLSLMREQQAAQLLDQQRLQDQISMGIQGKGGTQQQSQQSVFGDSAPQPTLSETTQESQMLVAGDIDSGGGYYRNPYASGYGMGYQNPMMSAYSPAKGGSRYTPRYGMLGPTGFGAYGAYSPFDTYDPYASASPYDGGKGGYMPQPVYRPYGGKGGAQLPPFDTYGANMAGATAADQGSPAGVGPPVTPPAVPPVTPPVVPPVTLPAIEDEYAGMDRLTMIEQGVIPPDTTTMDSSNVDFNSTTLQGAAIAGDGSNVVDFTPYTGDEFVRIGDQVVSRAELQRRGSDYYTKPVTPPGGRLAGPGTGLDPSIDQVMRDQVIVDPPEQGYIGGPMPPEQGYIGGPMPPEQGYIGGPMPPEQGYTAGPMPPEQDYIGGPMPPSMLGFVPTPYPYSTMMPRQVYSRRQMPSGKGGY